MSLLSFNDPAPTEIYTLSLHDALPISVEIVADLGLGHGPTHRRGRAGHGIAAQIDRLHALDRKSTRLNSSHGSISYAVFCLKKKKPRFPTLTYSCSSFYEAGHAVDYAR